MGTARANDLKAFRDFADAKLSNGETALTLEEALDLWEYENSSEEEREETIRAIQEGLDDLNSGRTMSFEDFSREFRERHGLPKGRIHPATDELARVLEAIARVKPNTFVREVANLQAEPQVQARIDKLAEKANEGKLTPEERSEYASYVEALDVVSIFQAKARSVLGTRV